MFLQGAPPFMLKNIQYRKEFIHIISFEKSQRKAANIQH